MRDSARPTSRLQFFFFGLLLLAFAAWTAHDGLNSLRTGQPTIVLNQHVDFIESFACSAGGVILGCFSLAAAFGWIKLGPQEPR